MIAKIYPSKLSGDVKVPSSKSYSHRLLISAFLSQKKVIIDNLLDCNDTKETLKVLSNLGLKYTFNDNNLIINDFSNSISNDFTILESGSTIRFMIPIISYFFDEFSISSSNKLLERLKTKDLEDLKGLDFIFSDKVTVMGKLNEKEYNLSVKNTTQLVSGMIFIMPYYKFKLNLDCDNLPPYVKMTLNTLNEFGYNFDITNNNNGISISYIGKKEIDCNKYYCEIDYSNYSYYLNMLYLGNNINPLGLINYNTLQGDSKYIQMLEKINEGCSEINIFDTPDLGPALFSYLSVSGKTVKVTGIEKLFIKESNRVESMMNNLNMMGADIKLIDNYVLINGKDHLLGDIIVDSYNDHRVVMSLVSIASKCLKPFSIKNCMAINKSYPKFFDDYKKINGKVTFIEDGE